MKSEVNFTFRVDRDLRDWLSTYAGNAGSSASTVIRDLIGALRNGIHATEIQFAGYTKVPIGDGKVVLAPSSKLQTHLKKAVEVAEVLRLGR